MSKKVIFSIIIPCRVETPYLKETLSHLKTQTFKDFEILVITDKISSTPSPSVKRNVGAKMAKGKYLAFLDDDSYPSPDWLLHAKNLFFQNPDLCAVCGPCLTPPDDNVYQQASGLVWGSFLGSGGAGVYRNSISDPRYVDDFPSVNLIVNRHDFFAVNGFNTHHWPGEDTILCLDLITKLNKKIYYHPDVLVFHHRRSVVIHHLQQITRYALHRGNFARIYPKTSLRLGYLLPSFFLIYLLFLPFYGLRFTYYVLPLYLYLFILFLTFLSFIVYPQSGRRVRQAGHSSFTVAALAAITIPITHLYYGLLFLVGFFTPKLSFKAHKLDKSNSSYLGG